MTDEDVAWWPSHVQAIFAAIGKAMAGKRLTPETLRSVPKAVGSILPGHVVVIKHLSGESLHRSGKQLGWRKGRYEITVLGSRFEGRWSFLSGNLEKLSRSAAAKLDASPPNSK